MIRKATLNDLRAVQELNDELMRSEDGRYHTNYNLEWTKGPVGTEYFKNSITDERACTFVAIENESVIGYLVGWIYKKQNPCRLFTKTAEIENMLVAQSYRSKGIGGGLVKSFLAWAKEREVDHVKVGAIAQNTRAIEFYRRYGFKDYELILELSL